MESILPSHPLSLELYKTALKAAVSVICSAAASATSLSSDSDAEALSGSLVP